MAISIRYPNSPQAADVSGFVGGLDALGEGLDNRRARKGFDSFDDWLRSQTGGQQPMSLASLEPQPQQQAPDPASGGDTFTRFMKTVQAGGVTNPAALAAIASTGKNESGFDAKNAVSTWSDPSQSGQPGTSGGIMSWRGPRLAALQKFAQENGDNPNAPAPETQAKYLLAEDPSLIQKLQQARTPAEAQQMMNEAWRFAGYNQPGGEAGERIADANALVGQFGGQSAPQGAVEAFAGQSGQPTPQNAPQATQGGSMLPPADVMKQLFRSEQTRPLAIAMAQTAIQARQGDPEAALKMRKLAAEVHALENPQEKPTDDMREYRLAVEQGFTGSMLDYQIAQKKAGATNVTTNVGEGDKFFENLDKKNAETFGALSETGVQARSKLAQIDRLEGLLANAPQGAVGGLKQAIGEFGINTEGLDDIQSAQALINELVPQQRQPGSGPMSDADLALFKQSLPRVLNQPGGNQIIIQTMRGIAEYQVKMGEIADAVADREMTPKEGREAIRNLENPLANFKGGGATKAGGLPSGVSEDDIAETMRANNMTREQVLERLQKGR